MSARIVSCRPQGDYTVWIKFADGVEGTIRLENLLDIGYFRCLRDARVFMTARPDPENGSLAWPSAGLRLDPAILYADIVAAGEVPVPPPGSTIDPGFYRFMARALEPVRLRARKKPDDKNQ